MTRGEIWWVDFGLAYGSIKNDILRFLQSPHQ